jgi:hypothetical protein
MRMAYTIATTLCVSSVACTEKQPSGWTRVLASGSDGVIYFVHADREADVCVTLSMSPTSEYSSPDDVGVVGADLTVGAAWGEPYRPSCTNEWIYDFDGQSTAPASGKVKFDGFINTVDTAAPCTVSFDLSIVGEEERVYEISAKDFPILDVGCPRPGVYQAEYEDLDAAYGQYDGGDMLVVSTWDEAREVCVWARFSKHAELPASAVEIPDAWVYAGLRFGLVERDACVASNFIIPPTSPEYLSDSAPELDSTGTVTFAAISGELPCELDIELDLRSQGRFDWTPDDVHMQAKGVAVSGVCD